MVRDAIPDPKLVPKINPASSLSLRDFDNLSADSLMDDGLNKGLVGHTLA
jgi:hypothetical protein